MDYFFKRLLPAIFILIASHAFAQKQETISLPDSMKNASELAIAKWYVDAGYTYINPGMDIPMAHKYAEQGLDFSRKISCTECEARALALMANLHRLEGRYEETLLLCIEILDKYAQAYPHIQSNVYNCMALVFEKMNALEEAIKYKKLLCGQLRKEKEYNHLFYALQGLINYYGETGQYALAFEYSRQAMSVAVYCHDDWIDACKYNLMGNAFADLANLDSALYYFHLAENAAAYDIRKNNDDSVLWCRIRGNIGEIYYKQGHYDKALPLFKRDFEISKKIQDTLGFLDAGYDVANTMLRATQYQECGQLLDWLIVIGKSTPAYYKSLSQAYKVYSDLYSARNKLKEALLYATLRNQVIDSLNKAEKSDYEKVMGTIADHDFQLIKTQAEKIKLDQRIAGQTTQNIRLRVVLFVLGALLLLLILSFLYLKRLRDHKEKIRIQTLQNELAKSELKTKEFENEKLKEEMEYKKSDLTDFAINLTQQQDFINDMLSRVKEINKGDSPEIKQKLKELSQQLYAYLNINDKATVFREKVEKINAGFFARLEEFFPELTPGEKELCGLIRLRLNNKEIAIIKNISPDSVKVDRYRLRRKLNLTPEEDITEFLLRL